MKIRVVTGVVLSALVAGCVSTETTSMTPPADLTPPAGDPAPNPDPAPTPDPVPDPAPADPGAVTAATKARYIEYGPGSSSYIAVGRTETAVDVDLTGHPDGKVDIKPKGTMTGGAALPVETGMTLVDQTATTRVYEGTDAFLSQVSLGPDMGFGIFRRKPTPNAGLVGYSVEGNRTQNMPPAGSATFNGAAALTVVQDTLVENASGTASLTASFGAGATISGRISDIKLGTGDDDTSPFAAGAVPLGADIVLDPAAISGNGYQNGTLRLVEPGGATDIAGTVNHTDYSGSFFGSGAAGTGGTLHYKGTGMGNGIGNIEMIGGFYGNK